jgi:hypothetical protein
MSNEVGVPVGGAASDAFTRERASATPIGHRDEKRAPAAHLAKRAQPAKAIAAELRPLQEWFAAAVMHPSGVSASVSERGSIGREKLGLEDVERVIRPSSRLSGLERIEIYHDAYLARLVECLADDYPALRHALGEDRFEAHCRRYIAAHPSRSPNLNAFGRHMADFCRKETAVPAFAADLAALEWALVEVVHTATADALSEEALSRIPPADWPGARFLPSTAVRVLEFGHAVNAYFQAFNVGGEPAEPEPGWSATAVFRDGATIWRMDMSRPMHALLAALFAGSALGEAIDGLASSGELTEAEAPRVMAWFRDWVRYGFFASIST